MAYGYKIVLASTLGKRSLFGSSKNLKLALQRSCQFTSYALLHCYSEYLPTPPDHWSELHTLYLHAQNNKLLDAKSDQAGGRPEFAMSVASAYKRLLMTSLVDPYHLAYGDVWNVYDAFARCADEAAIGAIRNVGKSVGLFVIDPDLDQQPLTYSEAEADLSDSQLLLDTNPVIETLKVLLQTQKTAANGVRSSPQIYVPLLGAMIKALAIPPKSHTPRELSEGRVGLTTGLSSLHHFIGGQKLRDLQSTPVTAEEEIDLGTDTQDGTVVFESTYTAEFWELQNRGPGGIGVVKRIRPNITVRVGELIGVQFPLKGQSGTNWTIGVVRWLSIANAGEYQAGVQVLATSAEPVTITIPTGDSTPEIAPRAALAIPNLASSKAATLIVPPGFFARNVPFLIRTPTASVEIKADILIE